MTALILQYLPHYLVGSLAMAAFYGALTGHKTGTNSIWFWWDIIVWPWSLAWIIGSAIGGFLRGLLS